MKFLRAKNINKVFSMVFLSLFYPKQTDTARSQALRQILSGAAATLVDLSSFQISLFAGFSIFIAVCNAFIVGTSTNYLISRYYVYGWTEKQKLSKKAQLPLYFAMALVSLLITQAGLWLLAVKLGILPIIAKIIMVPVVYAWSFTSSKFMVFYTN